VIPAALPIPRSLHAETMLFDEDGLTILASSETSDAPCPLCGERADRVHSRYVRVLADLPWATLAVHLRATVRKFFCDNPTPPAPSTPSVWPESPKPTPAAPTDKGSG
jgi:transposase